MSVEATYAMYDVLLEPRHTVTHRLLSLSGAQRKRRLCSEFRLHYGLLCPSAVPRSLQVSSANRAVVQGLW